MTRVNRLTNEELEEIRERAEKAVHGARYHDSDAIFASYCRMNLPKLLAEIERLNDRLRDVEILYNECSTELDSYYK